MLDGKLKQMADEFVQSLMAAPDVAAFLDAKASMECDVEFSALYDRHSNMTKEFRTKQANGTYTQDDISKLRDLYKQVSEHPAKARFEAAKDGAVRFMRSCNQTMSGLLGFDFAANAAPKSCSC